MHQTLQLLTELQVWWVVKFQVLEGWHKMAGVPTVAMIPALGRIFEGLMWDITEKQSDEIDSDISVEPIEDPQRAYLIDFNQDKPAKLSVTIIVSANPCGTYSNIVTDALGRVGNVANLARLTVCYKLLVDLKRKQTTTPDALINVYTGHYFYRNMAITHISTSRDSNNPNVLIIDLDLMVSIHAPAWGATLKSSVKKKQTIVSIHAPAWGATLPCVAMRIKMQVSIHAPAWGATFCNGKFSGLYIVSIHAPAWGATSR